MTRLRRHARGALLAGGFIAALAIDVWYDIGSFWAFRFLRVRTWNPILLPVAFAVIAAVRLHRTRTPALSGYLDARFTLKDRLVSAYRFRRLAGLPVDMREAQARETLRVVDFSALRAAFRFRPWPALAALVAGLAVIGWHMHRYPDSFFPRNLAFREGRVVFLAVQGLGGSSVPKSEDSTDHDGFGQQDSSHPQVAIVSTQQTPGQPAPGESGPGVTTQERPPAEDAAHRGSKPNPEANQPSDRVGPPEERQPQAGGRGKGEGSRPGSVGGVGVKRPASVEETKAASPPTARPASGLATAAAHLDAGGSRSPLPPLPLVRLLSGAGQDGSLFDPESLNVVLEAYPPKFRAHLEAYLKALQILREEHDGTR